MKKIRMTTVVSLVVLIVCAAAGCRREDLRRVEIRTPGIRSEPCARLAERSLRSLRGVRLDSLAFDFEAGTMTVEYDSMVVALKNIELALASAGFDANDVPADPEAAAGLPAECRVPSD